MHKDIYCSMCGEHADNCKTKEEKQVLAFIYIDNKNNTYKLYKVIDGGFEFIDKSENIDKILKKADEIKHADLFITELCYCYF